MADTSILLKKTQEARLSELYQTKCDEVSIGYYGCVCFTK